MILDFHVHPDFSIDAQGKMIDYARNAQKAGISELCFTTHLDLVPEREHIDGFVRVNGEVHPVDSDWIPDYFEEVIKVQDRFQSKGLLVRIGLEVDYHPAVEHEIDQITSEFPFDYILGAVHSIEGQSIAVPEDCRVLCRDKKPEELCQSYFDLLMQAVKSNLFDSLAHLDLYKRFSYDLYKDQINHAHIKYWEPVCKEIVKQKTAVEINTGNLRKGFSQPNPSEDLLTDLYEAGAEYITVGSDAHHPSLVGYHILEAYRVAERIGFENIYRFVGRSASKAVQFKDSEAVAI